MKSTNGFRGAIFVIACSTCLLRMTSADDKVLFESLNIGNRVVKNVRVTDSTPTHVTIFYDGGGSRLKRQDLPSELKALYSYDAKEVAQYEKEQAADKERRAAEETARQEKFNRELKATLLRQRPVVQQKIEQLQKELNQLEKEMGPMKGKASRKPRSPARAELDAARDKKQSLIHRIGEQRQLLDNINKQLDRSP